MTREEIEGVAAHELAHIKHRHMLVGTMAATMAGAVAMLASVARWGAIFGGGRDADRNPFVLIAMSIVAPMAAMIIQFAISRQNEFQADATAAEITGNPHGAGRWTSPPGERREADPHGGEPGGGPVGHREPPPGGPGNGLQQVFSTHPPTEERISRLEGLVRGGMR
jgi:heat shock protein HtpX